MKKVLAIVLAMVMIFIVVGCTKADEKPAANQPTNKYTDGTYIAFGNGTFRGYGMAEVTIKDDVIVDVKLTEFNGFNVEKPEDYAYEAFHTAKDEMPGRFVAANGTNVETITGATSSSKNWILAVDRALEKALVTPASTSTYFNGVFYGASEGTERGRGIAVVTIENDVITKVELFESTFTRDDNPREVLKDAEYGYAEWHEAVAAMPEKFVAANGTNVDTFTGATSSTNKWKAAIEAALQNAKR